MVFGTSKEGGGKSGTGQKLGKLVTRPLTYFSKLTGKNGVLESHEKTNYHLTNKTRAMEFMLGQNQASHVSSQISK